MSDNECTNCETRMHIDRVRRTLWGFIEALRIRGESHDLSKLAAPEAEGFATCTHKLKGLTYGSDEYKDQLKEMKPFLDHHYANNRHHPEHHVDGIAGMNVTDLTEMLADWYAASKRHADGCIARSLVINADRFGIPRAISTLLHNTASDMFPHEMRSHAQGICVCYPTPAAGEDDA